MLIAAVLVQLAVMLGAPIGIAFAMRRAAWGSWPVVGAGAFAWMSSQVVHLPLNEVLEAVRVLGPGGLPSYAQVAVLAATAGLCEEPARYLVLRFVVRRARSHGDALAFGVGHGGIESMFFGLLAGSAFLQMIAARDAPAAMGLDATQSAAIAAYWASPAGAPLLAALERLMAITFHVSASCLVVAAITRRAPWIVLVSIVWHTVANFVAVGALRAWGAVASEVALLGCMPVAVAIIVLSRSWVGSSSELERSGQRA